MVIINFTFNQMIIYYFKNLFLEDEALDTVDKVK